MDKKRLHAIVRGRVQGVNFRWYTRQRASQLGLTGWIRNLRDGQSVEVVAEGEANEMADFVLFLHEGPPMSRVDDVEVKWEETIGKFTNFSIRI
ncbi:MAG: acylphosphatase [Anaerolineales bacterium]|nr:acylphosphatase [Anaerolineales bacterium]